MNRVCFSCATALCIACFASAAPGKKSLQQDRSKMIWSAVHDQINTQVDAWFELGEFPKIIQLLKVQNLIAPEDYEVATNLGWMLENVEQFDEALAIYVRFRKQNPTDPDSSFPEANFYFMKKAYAKIPTLLEPALAKNPQRNAYRTLAHSYDRMKMYADSKRIWEAFLKRFPEDEAAKLNLSKVINKMKPAQK